MKLIIADDHELIRKGVIALLASEEDIAVVCEAASGQEVLDYLQDGPADLVLMDLQMPVMDGIVATRKLTQHYPETKVIVVSLYLEDAMILDVLHAGAKGYLLKGTSRSELIDAIRTVFDGGSFFTDQISVELTRLLAGGPYNPYHNSCAVDLTDKEREIITCICREYSSKQIAPIVSLTQRTVENYRERIQEKIGAKNMVGIVLYAIRHGLIRP